jgi:hypothetical protein
MKTIKGLQVCKENDFRCCGMQCASCLHKDIVLEKVKQVYEEKHIGEMLGRLKRYEIEREKTRNSVRISTPREDQ